MSWGLKIEQYIDRQNPSPDGASVIVKGRQTTNKWKHLLCCNIISDMGGNKAGKGDSSVCVCKCVEGGLIEKVRSERTPERVLWVSHGGCVEEQSSIPKYKGFLWAFEQSLLFEEQQGRQYSWIRVSKDRERDVRDHGAPNHKDLISYCCLEWNEKLRQGLREDWWNFDIFLKVYFSFCIESRM